MYPDHVPSWSSMMEGWRTGRPRHGRMPASAGPRASWRQLVWHVCVTVAGGYLAFVAIIDS
jgi:hypothetical protein